MKGYSFSLWIRLTISAAIGALFYYLSRYRDTDKLKEKTYGRLKKTRDMTKRLFSSGHAVEDGNKSVMYTLSKNARR